MIYNYTCNGDDGNVNVKIEIDSAEGRICNYVYQNNGDGDEESAGGVGVESFEDSGDDGKIGSDSPAPPPASTIQQCKAGLHGNTMQCTLGNTLHCGAQSDMTV